MKSLTPFMELEMADDSMLIDQEEGKDPAGGAFNPVFPSCPPAAASTTARSWNALSRLNF